MDMPEIGASEGDNRVITEAADTLRQRYPNMFKPSRNCRPPHVNLDVLRNQMCGATLVHCRPATALLESSWGPAGPSPPPPPPQALPRGRSFEAQLLKRHKLATADALVDWLLQTNQAAIGSVAWSQASSALRPFVCQSLAQQTWTLEKASRIGSTRALQSALAKAKDNEFFLGLSAEWPQHS